MTSSDFSNQLADAVQTAAGWTVRVQARRGPPASGIVLAPDLILTADHGCDPTTKSTDHSREYVPLLVYSKRARAGVNLGTRKTLSDIGQTVAENFGTTIVTGESFLPQLILQH